MVHHQIHNDADAPLFGPTGELDKIPQITQARIDAVVIHHVVAVVFVGSGVEGHQPEAGNTQAGEVVHALSQTDEIANAVAIAVHVGFYIQAVDDGVFIPEVKHGVSGW